MSDQLPAGTPITDASSGYTNYTAEQLEKLETLKDPTVTFGIARKECVNTVLQPDGTHVKADGATDAVVAAASAALTAALAGAKTPAALERATAISRLNVEISDHVAQKRFLFIVDRDSLPVVYFQCNTPDNPESMQSMSPHADDHPVLVADHPDPAAHAAQQAEVTARIAGVVATAKKGAELAAQKAAIEKAAAEKAPAANATQEG